MQIERVCERCGRVFYVDPNVVKKGKGRFCSKQCIGTPEIERICLRCGKPFKIRPANLRYSNRKYCSRVCSDQVGKRNKSKTKKLCVICGKLMLLAPWQSNQKTCSRECGNLAKARPITRICQGCHKEFNTRPCDLRKADVKFCSRECSREYHKKKSERKCPQCGVIFHTRNKDTKFCSMKCRGRFVYPPIETVCLVCGKKILSTKHGATQTCSKSCRTLHAKQFHHSAEAVEKIRITSKGRVKLASTIQKLSDNMKARWQDPIFISKYVLGMNMKPTKPEKYIIDICEKFFPDFEYNGDYRLGVSLGGLIPDFFNTNGKKQVIEVFGDYFHSGEKVEGRWNRTELGRIMAYNSVGYRCLILWEHEINKLPREDIVSRIKTFMAAEKC